MEIDETAWMPVIAAEALRDAKATKVDAFGTSVMLVRNGETVLAVASRCTHQGAPLDRGVVKTDVSDPTVTCPAHGSVFSLVDGQVRRGPATQPVQAFDARIADGTVEIRPRG